MKLPGMLAVAAVAALAAGCGGSPAPAPGPGPGPLSSKFTWPRYNVHTQWGAWELNVRPRGKAAAGA